MRILLARRRGRVAVLAALAAMALATTACAGDSGEATSTADLSLLGPVQAATGTPVKIGWVSTGKTQAVDTTDEIRGAQAAAAYANEHLGGLGGHPIQLVVCEDRSTPAQAQDCGNRFVTEKVSAVAGGSPGQTDPWIQIVTPAGIPAVLNFASTQIVLGTPNVFVWGNPLGAFGTPAAFAREHGVRKAAVLVIDVPAASGPARQLAPLFFGNAGSTANVVAVPPGTPDLTPQIQAAQSDEPGMYHILGDPTFCSGVIKAIRTLGITASITALDRCIGSDGGASIPGGFSDVQIIAQSNVDPQDAEFKLFSAVIAQYGGGLGVDANSVSGYQGMLGLVRAFNASGSTDTAPAGIIAALKSMPPTPYPLGGGATFQCDGRAIPAISPNICSTVGFVADAAEDGTVSNFRRPDATGIYELTR
ncbi:ABC transporter substrate-binding protein [Amycolatopsis thermoflava]|uniref:ABC transporter substrate-binding protein n=1 Tax=Amycolatopsis thermoflava TaxID=84480 RepID=UPI0037FE4983